MAILRLGGRVPEANEIDPRFNYGTPPIQVYEPPAVEEVAPEVIEFTKRLSRLRR